MSACVGILSWLQILKTKFSNVVEFKELNITDWKISNYELQIGWTVDKEKKEYCFCAVAIYTDNVLAEEISSLMWKTEQNACRQA